MPYYDAFKSHGITYLADEQGIPLMNEVDGFCRGKASRKDVRDVATHWDGRVLTNAEVDKVIEAACDVCPETRP